MLKINVSKLTIEDFEILRLNYKADINEVITFDDADDFMYFCAVVGLYKSWQIVLQYGLSNSQDLADEYGIEKPLEKVELLASYILHDVLEKYLEESCDTCEE